MSSIDITLSEVEYATADNPLPYPWKSEIKEVGIKAFADTPYQAIFDAIQMWITDTDKLLIS